jgi:hypothetical protein
MKAQAKYNRLHPNHPDKKKAHKAFVMEVAKRIEEQNKMRASRKKRVKRIINMVKFYLTDTILGISLAGLACGMLLTMVIGGWAMNINVLIEDIKHNEANIECIYVSEQLHEHLKKFVRESPNTETNVFGVKYKVCKILADENYIIKTKPKKPKFKMSAPTEFLLELMGIF